MGIMRSMWRFFSTLGGLVGSGIDERTDAMLTTPNGIKATFRQAREEWTTQYKEVRDAVSQLLVVAEQKATEIEKLDREHDELATRMNGAIERYKETGEETYKQAFADAHERLQEITGRLETLQGEKAEVERQVAGYKARLKEMQARIQDLDKQEAQSLADIVSSQQIVQLNDRLSNMSTTLQDQNLEAIERKRAQLKATAKLSSELGGHDEAVLHQELDQAGKRAKAEDAFHQMLEESKRKSDAGAGGAAGEAEQRDL
ncbi:MAG: hypothetical protein ACOCXA_01085 [Planctomycetota bacterium]